MPSFNLYKHTPESYYIEGELTFASINKKTVPSFDFLTNSKEICIDLKKVTTADSAGLALILEWLKYSKQHNTKLIFKNLPQQLLVLGTLSGLDLTEYLADDIPNLRLD